MKAKKPAKGISKAAKSKPDEGDSPGGSRAAQWKGPTPRHGGNRLCRSIQFKLEAEIASGRKNPGEFILNSACKLTWWSSSRPPWLPGREIAGTRWQEFIHADDLPELLDSLNERQQLEEGKACWFSHVRVLTSSGWKAAEFCYCAIRCGCSACKVVVMEDIKLDPWEVSQAEY